MEIPQLVSTFSASFPWPVTPFFHPTTHPVAKFITHLCVDESSETVNQPDPLRPLKGKLGIDKSRQEVIDVLQMIV